MIRYIHILTQMIAIMLIRLFHLVFVRRHSKLLVPLHKTPEMHVVIVANHKKAIDPFLVCSFLPVRQMLRLLPFCFITHNGFYDSPMKPFMWLLGCFPARNPRNKKYSYGVDGSIERIKKGYTLVIFPEGTRVKDGEAAQAKKGIELISEAFETPLSYILVRVLYTNGKEYLSYDSLADGSHPNAAELVEKIHSLPLKRRVFSRETVR